MTQKQRKRLVRNHAKNDPHHFYKVAYLLGRDYHERVRSTAWLVGYYSDEIDNVDRRKTKRLNRLKTPASKDIVKLYKE